MNNEVLRTVANIEVNLSTNVYERITIADGAGDPQSCSATAIVDEAGPDNWAILAVSGVVESSSLLSIEEVTKRRIADHVTNLDQEITGAKDAIVKVNERNARLRAASTYVCGASTIFFGSKFVEEVVDNGFNAKSVASGMLALWFMGLPLIQSVALNEGKKYSFVGVQRKTLDTLVESSKRLQKLEMLGQDTTTITKT